MVSTAVLLLVSASCLPAPNTTTTAIRPSPSAWDAHSVHAPSPVADQTGIHLYYDGAGGPDPYAGWSIGLATVGQEGWQRNANPVLAPGPAGAWDGVSVHDPRVIQHAGRHLMWYSGFDGTQWRIGLAESLDGLHWVKRIANPVFSPGPPESWDETAVAYSTVRWDGARYHMWYQGRDRDGRWRIGHATSPDGTTWDRDPANPVLSPGPADAWDAERVFTPEVVPAPEGWLMVYAGAPSWGLGIARSADGSRWRKTAANPVIRAGVGQQVMTPALSAGLIWYAEGNGEGLVIRTRPLRIR